MKKSLILPFLTLVCFYTASGQMENIQESRISREDGLPRNTITAILKDSKGFMWIGSRSGLSRYDGYNFVHYRYDANDSTSLSGDYIIGIFEDYSGTLWVASENGLNKFNREKETFRRFRHQSLMDPEEDGNLSLVVQGKNNTLWLATWSSRLFLFDLEKETFFLHELKTKEPDGFLKQDISAILEEEDGTLWLGCWEDGGLYKYDPTLNNKPLAHYSNHTNSKHRISDNYITFLFEDRSGDVWVSTLNGLNRISSNNNGPESETITHFYLEPENPQSISHNLTSAIAEDKSGLLWIRTGSGINTYNRNTGSFDAWEHDESGIFTVESYHCFRTLLIDNEGVIWFGLPGQNLFKLIIRNNKFELQQHNPDHPNSLSSNSITSIYQDTSGVLWIGTEEGLNMSLPGNNPDDPPAWHFYTHDPGNPSSISSNRIRTVYRDRQGVLWIGTVHGGLNKYIETGDGPGQFDHFDFDTSDTEYYNAVDIILEDGAGNFWLGTPLGLYLFDRESEIFYPYLPDVNKPDSLISVPVNSMVEDRNGAIWFGTWNDGIYKVSPPFKTSGSFITGSQSISFRDNENAPIGPGSWDVRSMLAPKTHKDQLIWIGTHGEGLFGLKEVKNDSGFYDVQVKNFTLEDGLVNDDIFGIEEDRHGELWLSTTNGLSRYNPEAGSFISYFQEDGLNTNLFGWLSHFISPSGELLYWNNGLLSFFPDSLYKNLRPPPVVLTEIMVNNQALSVGDDSPLKITSSEVREIILSHKQNNVSFEFAALNYIETQSNRYKYKLEGREEEWIDAGTKRVASYQVLSPGTYNFRVIASNNDAVWNEQGAELKIIIRPPWWKSTPAIISYIFILLILIYLIIKAREQKLIRDRRILEEKISERTKELREVNTQMEVYHEELEQQKEELQQTLNFLKETQTHLVQTEKLASVGQLTAGIAHEINNPVNYISAGIGSLELNLSEIREILDLYNEISPGNVSEKLKQIEEVKERLDYKELIDEISQLIKSIKAGSERTTEIVKGLRTFSRLDENDIKPADLHEGIDLTLVMLHNKYKHHVEIIKQYGDLPQVECFPGKLNQVFMNIVSNAVDAVGEKGTIVIKTWEDKTTNKVFVSIKDDGMGMSAKDISNIFNPFFSTKEVGKGTGLGLSISHGIIEQHKGSIKVKSEVGEGAEFIISLPVKQA